MKSLVFVRELEYSKGEDVFDGVETIDFRAVECVEEDLAEQIRKESVRILIAGVERYEGPVYAALAGGMIARFGVGVDGISRDLCERHNVILANTPGVLTESVAEHAIWLIGAVARHVARTHSAMRAGRFEPMTGSELMGKHLLIVGFGQIGRRVAEIAGAGFEMDVQAFDCLPVEQLARAEHLTTERYLARYHLQDYPTDLDEVLPWADVVSVHLPLNDRTRHFFDKKRFSQFCDGAVFVNTSRGAVVDERALFDALAGGKLSGAGIDVYETEPYQPVDADHDLRMLDNVVLTPHMGANTFDSNRRVAEACVQNCKYFLDGKVDRLTRVW